MNGKYGLNLTRENYVIVNQKISFEDGRLYNSEWSEKNLKNCLENFDLNMEYFLALIRAEFSAFIRKFLQESKEFSKVIDLTNCSWKPGYYMMVFYSYRQSYVGTAKYIKRRVMNQYIKTNSFYRLIFWYFYTFIISIDIFRAYDTIKIYAYTTSDTYIYEDGYINEDTYVKFLCNRTIGGLCGRIGISNSNEEKAAINKIEAFRHVDAPAYKHQELFRCPH